MLLAALVSQKKERAVVGNQVRNFNTTLRTLESPKSSPSMIFLMQKKWREGGLMQKILFRPILAASAHETQFSFFWIFFSPKSDFVSRSLQRRKQKNSKKIHFSSFMAGILPPLIFSTSELVHTLLSGVVFSRLLCSFVIAELSRPFVRERRIKGCVYLSPKWTHTFSDFDLERTNLTYSFWILQYDFPRNPT